MERSLSLKEKINVGILFAIVAWYILPIVSYKFGTIGLIILAFLWILTSSFDKFVKSFRCLACFIAWYLYMIFMFVLGAFNASGVSPLYFFTMTAVTVFPALLYSYYQRAKILDAKLIKKLACVLFLISAINTILVLSAYPTAAKVLAMSGTELESEKNLYYSMGCGGYGFIYSIVLIVVPLLFSKNESRMWNVLSIITVMLCIYTMILSQYTLAFLITCISIVFGIFFVSKNKSAGVLLVKILISLSLILVAFNISNVILFLANLLSGTGNSGLSVRLYEIVDYLETGEQGYNFAGRVDRYKMSWDLFLSSPIYGNQFGTESVVYGGHSALLDQLARYGIVGTVPYVCFVVENCKKSLDVSRVVVIANLAFLALSIFNTTIFVYQLGMVLFFVTPIIANDDKKLSNQI